MLTVRQSSLNTFEKCMWKGFVEYGNIGQTGKSDEEELTNKYARVGIVFHEVMEHWGLNKMEGKSVKLTELHELLDSKLNNEDKTLFKNDEEIETFRNSLHEQLDWCYEKCICDTVSPLGVEVTFSLDNLLPGFLTTTGTIDRIDGNMKNKEIRLGDYKTGKVYTKKELSNNIQATLYSLAFYKMFGFLPKAFDFYFTKHKKVKTIQITPEFLKRGTERILDIWFKIEQGEFKPTCKNKYFCKNFCDSIKECPKFNIAKQNNSWDNIM